MNLSNWLRKTPQPVAVMADDKRIEVGKNIRAFRDLLSTIKSLNPAKITCLNAEGNILRSHSFEAAEDEAASNVNPITAEQSDLQLFAKLLAEGYEHGRKANQPIIDSAMQFVERQSVRLAKAESEIERLRTHNHKLNLQILELSMTPVVEDAPSGSDSIMSAIVAGAMQGVSQQVTPIIKTGAKK